MEWVGAPRGPESHKVPRYRDPKNLQEPRGRTSGFKTGPGHRLDHISFGIVH